MLTSSGDLECNVVMKLTLIVNKAMPSLNHFVKSWSLAAKRRREKSGIEDVSYVDAHWREVSLNCGECNILAIYLHGEADLVGGNDGWLVDRHGSGDGGVLQFLANVRCAPTGAFEEMLK
jgi:hypothetical protein